MASTDESEVIIYTFVDGNEISEDSDSYKNNQDDHLSTLFKMKVAELKELVQVLPEKQKVALWDCWSAAQRFISGVFEKLFMDLNISEAAEYTAINKYVEKPETQHLPTTSGPHGAPHVGVAPINVKVETLNVPETYFEVVEHRGTKEHEKTTRVPKIKCQSYENNNKHIQTTLENENMKATEALKAEDSDNTDRSKSELSESAIKKSLNGLPAHFMQTTEAVGTSSNKESASIQDSGKVVHIQVERIDGNTENVNILEEDLSVSEEGPVIILQAEDIENQEQIAEDHTQLTKLQNTGQRKIKTETVKIKKKVVRGKGRPKRKEFSEMCVLVTKEDGERVFQCELCGVQMAHYPNLEVHLRCHTGQRPFSCSKCGKTFTTKGNMKEHEVIHETDRRQFECETCGKMFKQLRCLKIHTRIHTGERPYKCSVCNKTFTQPGVLQSHLLVHSDQRNHLCVTCGKSFRLKSQLELHKKRHEDKRDFKCDECNFETITNSDLLRHKATHKGEKRFSCTVCQKKFTRAHYLGEHMNIHYGKTPYKCLECDASFSLATKLYCHKRKHRRELAEKLLKEAQSKNVAQSSSEIKKKNQSSNLKMTDRHVEIQTVNPVYKLHENSVKVFHDNVNQSGIQEIIRLNPQQLEKELLFQSHSDSAVKANHGKESSSLPHVTENLWAGDEQYVELVVGQDISVEDLNTLISSKVISCRQTEGSEIESACVPISMQE